MQKKWRQFFFLFAINIFLGCLAGAVAVTLIFSLNFVTTLRQNTPVLIYFLPVIGFLIGWFYSRFGKTASRGHHLVIEELQQLEKPLPRRMAPFIFFSTLLTHLVGGSAGREGTAIQMGASLADQLSQSFKVSKKLRQRIILVAMSGAFGAASGSPLAGSVFALEIFNWRQTTKISWRLWFDCLVASSIGYMITVFFNVPHLYHQIIHPHFSAPIIFQTIILGVVCGLTAFVFMKLMHHTEKFMAKLIASAAWRGFFFGGAIVIFYHFFSPADYAGLGTHIIQKSFHETISWSAPFLKAVATVLTLAAGFKGGEFVPLIFMGTTLGNVFATSVSGSISLFAALGSVAVFAGAAHAPITCTLMAVDFFGIEILPLAAMTCVISHFFAGKRSLYRPHLSLKQ